MQDYSPPPHPSLTNLKSPFCHLRGHIPSLRELVHARLQESVLSTAELHHELRPAYHPDLCCACFPFPGKTLQVIEMVHSVVTDAGSGLTGIRLRSLTWECSCEQKPDDCHY